MAKPTSRYSPVCACCPELRQEQAAAFLALRDALQVMWEAASRVMEPAPVETLKRAIRRWCLCHRSSDPISERTAPIEKILMEQCGEFGGMVKFDEALISEVCSQASKLYATMDRWL
jgi:hypothetical protein